MCSSDLSLIASTPPPPSGPKLTAKITTKPRSQFFGVGYGFSTDYSRSVTCILFYHSILSKVILFVISLIDILFLFFLLSLFFIFIFFSFPQLESTHSFSTVHYCFPLNMTTPFQATIPLLFINRGHPIFKQFFFF